MKFNRHLVMTAALCAVSAFSAHAQETSDRKAQSVYTMISPFGLSVGYAHRTAPHWVSRVQLNTGSPETSNGHLDLGSNRYDIKQKTGAGLSTFTDYYPSLDSGWRLTGGFVISRVKLGLTGQANGQGNYRLNDHDYSAAQVGTLTGKLRFNPVNLYLGGGWESGPIETKGWRFVSDAGLIYGGKASATLTATGADTNAALQADVNAERSRLEKNGLGVMIALGAAYSF